MRRLSISAAALGAAMALALVGFASAAGEGPVTVRVGGLEFETNANFTPKSGPKGESVPLLVDFEGKVRTVDGTHPPALTELAIEADKNGRVSATGIPTCSAGQLQSRDTEAAEAACGPAIIGEGRTTVEVAFPDQRPIPVNSKLLLVNGGTSGGTITWYVHAYFNAPISGAIVSTVKIKKHPNGRFGTLSVASIPKIAGGSGSVTSFGLKIDKNVEGVGGKTYHPITGECTDGKVLFHLEAKFADGTKAAAEVVRACTARG